MLIFFFPLNFATNPGWLFLIPVAKKRARDQSPSGAEGKMWSTPCSVPLELVVKFLAEPPAKAGFLHLSRGERATFCFYNGRCLISQILHLLPFLWPKIVFIFFLLLLGRLLPFKRPHKQLCKRHVLMDTQVLGSQVHRSGFQDCPN